MKASVDAVKRESFARGFSNHSGRGHGARAAASVLFTSTLFLVLACAPPHAHNQNAAAASPQQTSTPAASPQQTSSPAAGASQAVSEVGDVRFTAITHASFQIEYGGKVIHVDPSSAGDYSAAKQADLILVTDIHGDHLDPAAIKRVRKAGAPVVAPSAAADKIESPTVISNGETKTVAGVSIEAVPMYNIQRRNPSGELFHTKGRGNGYVLTLGDKRVYIAGDTECTDEMRALKNIDAAFVPMNLPYTMPPPEAAECVKAFKPKVVFPYHFKGQNPEEFKAALAGEPIEVRLLKWY
jgi:L-ascorbate metabolism protein UlaG (beta-lactamase superfamily)